MRGNPLGLEFAGRINIISTTSLTLDNYSTTRPVAGGVRLWRITYDQATQTTNALSKVWKTFHDSVGRVVQTQDPLTLNTYTFYDQRNNVGQPIARTKNADGSVTTRSYGFAGYGVRHQDARGFWTNTVFDLDDRAQVQLDGVGNETFTGYDAIGRATLVTDALSQQTQTTYDLFDGFGRAYIQTTDALFRYSSVTFDAAGREILRTDELGLQSTMAYDTVGRLQSQTDSCSYTTSFGYDEIGRRVAVTDARTNTTQTD